MIRIHQFTFNPFQENTFLLSNETHDCLVIDPGCYFPEEKELLLGYLNKEKLTPVRLLNTHCHIDHVFGNAFIAEKFDLSLEIHEGELPVLNAVAVYGENMGFKVDPPPANITYLKEGETIEFGNDKLEIIMAPGHSPASLCFLNRSENWMIGGDVLFRDSIGRTDLPGGDHETLLKNIREKIYILPDEVTVYPGHGPSTTIGYEKQNNPFVKG